MRQAEVGAARTMIERTPHRFGLYPERLAADSAYGSAEMLAWLVHDAGSSRTSRSSTSRSATTGPSAEPSSPTIIRPRPTSALPGRNSGNARRPIGCRSLSSMRTA